MSSRGRYTKISDAQREILIKFYKDGMTSKASVHEEKIKAAAQEANLDVEKIKKWIGNYSAKIKAQAKQASDSGGSTSQQDDETGKPRKIPKFQKGPSSFNVFCAEYFKSDDCAGTSMAAKNSQASQIWKAMPIEEKLSYSEKARTKRNPDLSKLTEDERDMLIKQHKKRLIDEVTFLEDMGCEMAGNLMDPSGELFNFGSAAGQMFLSSNHEVVLKFKEYFACQKEEYSYEDVTKLFNEKYSKAVGKPCRVPYLKNNFHVTGLPPDVTFRKPTGYGTQQLKKIMQCKDAIKFHIHPSGTTNDNNEAEQVIDVVQKDVSVLLNTLSKVVDLKVAEDALNGNLIEEEQLEVINLSLTNEDILVLLGQGRAYFSPDAWQALGANMKTFLCKDKEKGVVVPCFNQAEEPYWLFYIPGQLCNLFSNITDTKTFNGYWLDLDHTSTGNKDYIMLENLCKIVRRNIIKSDNGIPLFVKASLDVDSNTIFNVPSVFHETTLTRLRSLDL